MGLEDQCAIMWPTKYGFGFDFWIWVDGFDLGFQLMGRLGFVIGLLGIIMGCNGGGGGGCLTWLVLGF